MSAFARSHTAPKLPLEKIGVHCNLTSTLLRKHAAATFKQTEQCWEVAINLATGSGLRGQFASEGAQAKFT